MNENITTQNLNSYYSSNPKTDKLAHNVVNAPVHLPTNKLCRDEDMNKKMRALNKDIYQSSKTEKHKSDNIFWKCFGGSVLLILVYKFLKKLWK